MFLARLTDISNRFPAFENAHHPERLGRVFGVQEMPTIVFGIVDAHAGYPQAGIRASNK
jgi:hypothetical protein